MKNLLLTIICILSLSSCATLFTPTKQRITFTGLPETRIYDNGKKLGEIDEEGVTTIKIRKRLSDKTLIAKKEGYKSTPIILDATFNPVSIINLSNVLAWAIDLGTGKCCKWDTDVVEIEMEKKESEK